MLQDNTGHYSIVVARKPLSEKSVVENVLKYGTGGINIDGSRIPTDDVLGRQVSENDLGPGQYGLNDGRKTKPTNKLIGTFRDYTKGLGRFPANIIFDEEAGKLLDEQSGISKSNKRKKVSDTISKPNIDFGGGIKNMENEYDDKGGASRFFYCVKDENEEYEIKNNNMNIDLRLGDCIEVLKTIPDNSVDSIVTDPPYHLTSIVKRFGKEDSAPAQFGTDGAYARASKGFMGKEWDGGDIAFRTDVWNECLRILKPGGHLLAFSHSRTYHRMAVAVEDAGFEIRDQIMWVYGSGFPKSLNIGKAIDKRGGESIGWFGEWLKEWREQNNIPQSKIAELFPSKTGGLTGCVSNWELGNNLPTNEQFNLICETFDLPFKSLEEAEREYIGTKTSGIGKAFTKDGWGSGHDEVEITRGSSEWEGWGTALKPAHEPIVMARKPLSEKSIAENVLKHGTGGINIDGSRIEFEDTQNAATNPKYRKEGNYKMPEKGQESNGAVKFTSSKNEYDTSGRFPANIIFDEEAGQLLDEQSGISKSSKHKWQGENNAAIYGKYEKGIREATYDDKGGASRFFYCPKTSKKDRNEGLEKPSSHPTVKPTDLMRYLINLVTPKGGTVLDPFMGSGSTGKAAVRCGVNFIGIEKEQEYMDIAEARINHEKENKI